MQRHTAQASAKGKNMPNAETVVVFVHGWSVTNTRTYGGLPQRLRDEAKAKSLDIRIKHIFLGRYISFHDEVQLSDVSRAFRAAVADQIAPLLKKGRRFVCITHSTGGPVVRDWWHRYYDRVKGSGTCPMSHLIMLAPANFGSALAQLGTERIGRLKSWLGGIEPGRGILNWLELGSSEAWELNKAWIEGGDRKIGVSGLFPFVLTGQSIDRALYDNLNPYTGESGSDGVVRVAAANLNSQLVKLVQEAPRVVPGKKPTLEAPLLKAGRMTSAPETPLRVISRASHTGSDRGIMRSVRSRVGHKKGADAVAAILQCVAVKSKTDYRKLLAVQKVETAGIQEDERLETESNFLPAKSHFIHDRCSMVIFRVVDDHGYPVRDFDLLLTAGSDSDPNGLPRGFFIDRQLNRRNKNTITYFFNFDIMNGAPEVRSGGKVIRPATRGAECLGFRISPRPSRGFVHYLDCEIKASKTLLKQVLKPNCTTMIDIVLQRVVRKNVFRMARMQGDSTAGNFKKTRPGSDIAD